MAHIVGVFEGDFDAWKPRFDSDPLGRAQIAKAHTVLRGIDNPNEIFIRIDFESAEDAKSFQDKVRNSDVLQDIDVKIPPTAVEVADQVNY
ncbi:MAG: hypothetical protein JO287_00290 [Pseudonocardiales bacterium]|nr:hypothetical protein [Pseudonocardiales bacterium]